MKINLKNKSNRSIKKNKRIIASNRILAKDNIGTMSAHSTIDFPARKSILHPSGKQILKDLKNENLDVRKKHQSDVTNMLKDKKISELIRQLRIPHSDDNGVAMMNGIYSLGTYIQSLISDSLRKNKLFDKVEYLKKKPSQTVGIKVDEDEYEDSDEIEEDENENQAHGGLDISASGPMIVNSGRGHYSSKMSKSTLSPSGRSRFIMSPFVKSIINNHLATKKQIGLSKTSIGVVMNDSPGTIGTSDDTSHSPNPQPIVKLSSKSFIGTGHDITVNFNKTFLGSHNQLPFVQQMLVTNRKKWTEKRTEVQYNPDNIQILIADDSAVQIKHLKAILGKTNVVIDTAQDGNEAYDRVESMMKKGIVYHLILMDVHMPECDGYEATKNIRKLEQIEKVTIQNHIVAISADDNELTVSLYHEAGMNAFIKKPLSSPILYKVLQERAEFLGVSELLKCKV